MESEWLREALQLSFRKTVYTSSTDDGKGPPEQRDPRLKKLIEGVLFTRRFVPTYNLFLLGFFVGLSALHWSGELLRWRRRRAEKLCGSIDGPFGGDVETIKQVPLLNEVDEVEGSSSSGSSTLEGAATPSRKNLNEGEETPLLPGLDGSRPHRSMLGSLRAALMYQPPPIPFINKILPSNGMCIVVLGLFGLNAFYSFHHINFTVSEIFVLADRMGSQFVANLPLLYLLAAKNHPLKVATGCSYEFLNIFHRRLGEILCLQAFLHAAGMICVWYTLFRPAHFGLIHFLLISVNVLGIGAFLSYEILYFTSLASFRRRWYELFLGTHVALQAAALAFVFFHHSVSRPYVGTALGIFLADRAIYRLGLKSTAVRAETYVLEDGETVKLSTQIIRQPLSSHRRLVARCIRDGWQATDHVFITIPALGRSHALQAHPFTISSAAPPKEDDQGQLDLLIRAQDGFSRDLLQRARQHTTMDIRIDGPYGSSHARSTLEDSQLAICVAGGSGIAVILPLVHHLLETTRSTDSEIAPIAVRRRQKIVLIWVVHKASHLSWVEQQVLVEMASRGVEVIIPPATEQSGRPDLASLVGGSVETYGGCAGGRRKVGVVASGPDGMGRMVRNTCAGLARDGVDIDVTIEKFGW